MNTVPFTQVEARARHNLKVTNFVNRKYNKIADALISHGEQETLAELKALLNETS